MLDESRAWAREQFGQAVLGDCRRVVRLVSMAAEVARRPAGKVTEVFQTSAEREGAFRLLESTEVSAEQVAEAAFNATARACKGLARIYVPLDGSSLTLSDRAKRRELGRVGSRWPTRGLLVMSALGVDERGATIGLLAQRWWTQAEKPPRKKLGKCTGTKYRDRATRHWLDAMDDVSRRLDQQAPGVQPWFQLDRGGDCWPVWATATEGNLLLTVRSCHDRRLEDRRGKRAYLRETLRRQPVLGHYDVELPRRPERDSRTARMTLRACTVVVSARVRSKKRRSFTINAVLAEEEGYRRKDRLRWLLLTTAPVTGFQQARDVVHGYTLRWRVEEFHRTWKKGLCRVEESQLQSRSALIKWATILGAVAARALRIAQLLRTTPDMPASEEFTDYEIKAVYALTKRKWDRRKQPSFKEIVGLIADLGGFAHKYSGGRPGPTVLGRGLANVQVAAQVLQNLAEMR